MTNHLDRDERRKYTKVAAALRAGGAYAHGRVAFKATDLNHQH
jgi:hypothetical protein